VRAKKQLLAAAKENGGSDVVAVVEKKFFHILDCVSWAPHVSSHWMKPSV
jgi:hypothetical protein